MTPMLPPLATRALEAVICDPSAFGDLEAVYGRNPDAWDVGFPDLASLLPRDGERRPIKFCIATEDIVGPVRNGGIGTTYAAVAEGLALRGHDITVLYLRGESVENETVEHWVEHYGAKGVKFVPVTDYAGREGLRTREQKWFAPMYNMYRWLLEHPMDVVHVSEWRGSGYLSLLAKRQGLGLERTLFLVKTSSPWLWNRLYESKPIEGGEELLKTYAERRSVELADMVIGGSAHLLRWMMSQGYAMPRERTFVQPNFVRFDHLKDLISRRDFKPGSRVAVDEIVFFGRLESRKGLVTFCQAVNRLVRLGHKLPPKVSFMGKPGARLDVRQRQGSLEFIAAETAGWPTEVQVHPNFQQYEALDYLLSGNRLAVMPSTIENSSLAVYEAAICGIPFIASATGGTPELVESGAHADVLCDPHPIPLADLMAKAIDQGALVAAASFDNDANVATWDAFHDALAAGLVDDLLARAEAATGGQPVRASNGNGTQARAAAAGIDVCLYSRGRDALVEASLASLLAQTTPPRAVLIAVDAIPATLEISEATAALSAKGVRVEIVEAADYDSGLAHNTSAARAEADYLLFLDEGATLEPEAIERLGTIAQRRKAAALTFFHRYRDEAGEESQTVNAELVGSPALAFAPPEAMSMPLLVERAMFQRIGGFTVDFRVPMHERELMVKALLASGRCESVPIVLGTIPVMSNEWYDEACYNVAASGFRAMRPFLAAAPLAFRELLLQASGHARIMDQVAKSGRGGVRALLNAANRGSGKADERAFRELAKEAEQRVRGITKQAERRLKEAANGLERVTGIVTEAMSDVEAITSMASARASEVAPSERETYQRLGSTANRLQREMERLVGVREMFAADMATTLKENTGDLPSGEDDLEAFAARVAALGEAAKARKIQRHYVSLLDDGPASPAAGGDGAGTLRHRVLDVRAGLVTGWAIDARTPGASVEVEAVCNGRVIGRSRPARVIEGSTTGETAGAGLFELPFVVPVTGEAAASRPEMTLRTADGSVLQTVTLAELGAAADDETTRVVGFAEPNNAGELRGWVYRPRYPDKRVVVAIYVDGAYLGRILADQYRGDVLEAGHGDGRYGFSYRLPRALVGGRQHRVELLVAGTGRPLTGTPLNVRGEHVRSEGKARGMAAIRRNVRHLLRRAGLGA
jgi:glycosyltransferase involved in cell wall biosynthesis